MNLARRVANNLGEGDRAVTGLDNPREMIRWAYEAKRGDISPIFEFGDRYVIARLDAIREEGTATLDEVYGEIENTVRNQKKADYLNLPWSDPLRIDNLPFRMWASQFHDQIAKDGEVGLVVRIFREKDKDLAQLLGYWNKRGEFTPTPIPQKKAKKKKKVKKK